jgi:C-3',4' desaturase CrtD
VTNHTLIIGAGIGGLVLAARLAKAGLDVTVLEAHVYAGGCAGTFFHQGYRFDAGATLAGGFYPGGPMDLIAGATGISEWPVIPTKAAMAVHLPAQAPILRWADERRHAERDAAFGPQSRRFWDWQEARADALWDLALRLPDWPPQDLDQATRLARTGLGWLASPDRLRQLPGLLRDATQPLAARLRGQSDALRLFLDGQLLISAQTTSAASQALFSAAALDLPRRGTVHVVGGMGALADSLVSAIRSHGGEVHFRQRVERIERQGSGYILHTHRRERFEANQLVANLPAWNLGRLFGAAPPKALQNLPKVAGSGRGAFTLYLGLNEEHLPIGPALHHQVIAGQPLGEGRSVFISLNSPDDIGRAPKGQRTITISTHTELGRWWSLSETDYHSQKTRYSERLLGLAERVLPGLSSANLQLAGTPRTFQQFTGREQGWVGGFPQVSLHPPQRPRLEPNLWLVGDSIFPGQSTAAVGLGGLRVANAILRGYRSRAGRVWAAARG